MKKPIIAIDLSSTGAGGGPYTSSNRIMNSSLNNCYEFKKIVYKTELGKGISLKRIFDIVKQLKLIKPDIVHFTGLQLSGFHMIVACILTGNFNTVVTVRGFSGDAIYFHPFKKLLLTLLIEPLTLLLAKKNYGVSNYVSSRRVMKLFKYKSFGFIYNFPPELYSAKKKHEIREELGLSKEDVVVVSVGRINKDKGYHVLEKALLKFKKINNIKFVIVGAGDYLEIMTNNLKKQIEEKQVIILGYRNDVQEIINGCDIFILPTLHETLSVALLEASVQGLALIASNTGGVPEIVENKHNGILVTPGMVNEIYDAIMMLLSDKKLISQMGLRAKMRIQEKFNNVDIVSRIDKVYKSMLEK